MHKNKSLTIFLSLTLVVCLLVLSILTACAKSTPTPTPTPTTSTPAATSTTPKPTTTPAATTSSPAATSTTPKPTTTTPAKVYTLNVVSAWEKTSTNNTPLLHLIDSVNAKAQTADGILKMEWKGGPETVKSADLPDAAKAGTIDFFYSSPGYYTGTVPETGWASIARSWTYTNVSEMWNAGIGNVINQAWQKKGLTIVNWGAITAYHLFSTKPFTSLTDMKGRQFRVPGGTWNLVATSMGASPVSLASAEVYGAMQRGAIDGAIQPMSSYVQYSYWEVATNIMDYPFIAVGAFFWTNTDKLNALPASLKAKFNEILKEDEKFTMDFWKTSQVAWEKTSTDKGAKFIKLSAADLQKLKDSLKGLDADVAKTCPADQAPIISGVYNKFQ